MLIKCLLVNISLKGESRFVCGQSGCNNEWPYSEVCKMALLTPEEKKNFEKNMAFNAARDNTKSVSVSYLTMIFIICTWKLNVFIVSA